jgi:hypothetical protein
MNRARKTKGSFQKARDKVEKREEELLTSQIQKVIGEELAKNIESILQSLKEQLQTSKEQLQTSKEQLQTPIEETKANVMLEGLNLPEENKNHLTSQIQQMIGEVLAKNAEARHVGDTCVCAVIGGPPGEEQAVYYGSPPSDLGYRLWTTHMGGYEDTFQVEINPDADVPKNMMTIGLITRTYSNWSKEIWAWDYCRPGHPGVRMVHIQNNRTPMKIFFLDKDRCDGGDTIVFRKPKELGIWHDVYHLYSSREEFWKYFGGTRTVFTWVRDNLWDPYPKWLPTF